MRGLRIDYICWVCTMDSFVLFAVVKMSIGIYVQVHGFDYKDLAKAYN